MHHDNGLEPEPNILDILIEVFWIFLTGVADGVGGWRQYGIDPSLFPKSLMSTCERLVKEGRFQPQLPAGLISTSYFELLENKEPLVGK